MLLLGATFFSRKVHIFLAFSFLFVSFLIWRLPNGEFLSAHSGLASSKIYDLYDEVPEISKVGVDTETPSGVNFSSSSYDDDAG